MMLFELSPPKYTAEGRKQADQLIAFACSKLGKLDGWKHAGNYEWYRVVNGKAVYLLPRHTLTGVYHRR